MRAASSYSCEEPVHEPARHVVGVAVGALAEKPVAAAVLVLNPIIVAARRALRTAPPFRRNALRALGAGNTVGGPAPAETGRRPFRHLGRHLDGLGIAEEPDRPLDQE